MDAGLLVDDIDAIDVVRARARTEACRPDMDDRTVTGRSVHPRIVPSIDSIAYIELTREKPRLQAELDGEKNFRSFWPEIKCVKIRSMVNGVAIGVPLGIVGGNFYALHALYQRTRRAEGRIGSPTH